MGFELIPQLVIIVSIGIVLVILGRKIPKIKDAPDDGFWSNNHNEVDKKEKEKFQYLYDRIKKRISREEYKKKMDLFWIWFEKLLRKVRINFLKFDNRIVLMIGRLREKNTESVEKTSQDAKVESEDIAKIESSGNMEKEENIKEEKKEFNWNDMNRKKEEAVVLDKSNISESIKSDEKTAPEKKVEPAKEEAIEERKENTLSDKDESIENLDDEDRTNREKKYIDMIMKNPIDIKAYWQLGIIYSRRRNYKDAIACFRQITKIDPTYFKAKKKITDLIGRMKKKKNIDGKEEEIDIDGNEEDQD